MHKTCKHKTSKHNDINYTNISIQHTTSNKFSICCKNTK